MVISHLVALSNNSVIGVNNDLPWTLKRDLQALSVLYTQSKAMVMGRKTFDSIGRPLAKQTKYCYLIFTCHHAGWVSMLFPAFRKQGIAAADEWNKENALDDEVVLIGGGSMSSRRASYIVNKLVLTRVDCEIVR